MAAATCGWLFNAFMPQGIGLMPAYLAHPLWQPVSLARAADLWQEGALFLDARDPGQYKRGHIRRAMNLSPPEREFLYPLLEPSLRKAKVIVVYGRSRSRFPAARIAQFLRQQGFREVWVLEARYSDWRAAGHPVRQPNRSARKAAS